MMKIRKIVTGVSALLILAALALFLNLGGAAKAVIERAASAATGTRVHLGAMDVSLSDKRAVAQGLSVANPAGFKSESLLTADSISVAVGGVTGQTVTIREMTVEGVTVTYELGMSGSNFDVIRKNMKSAVDDATEKRGGDARGLIIQTLRILNARVIPVAGEAQSKIDLPEIVISNIGSKSHPATEAQAIARVMQQVLSASAGAAARSGIGSRLGRELKSFLPDGLLNSLP